MVDFNSSISQQKRENLLDVVSQSMQQQGKVSSKAKGFGSRLKELSMQTTIYSRIVIVAKHSKREAGNDGIRALIQKAAANEAANEISGLLIVWPLCSACMLEARTSSLMAILRELLPFVSSTSNTTDFVEARVISSTEDITSRCFSGLLSTFVNSPSTSDTMDPCDSTTIVKVASDLNSFLRKTGQSLQGQTEAEVKRRLGSFESYFDNLPASETILSLTPAEDAPTLDEFLSVFDSSVNVDLQSESVYPSPLPLS